MGRTEGWDDTANENAEGSRSRYDRRISGSATWAQLGTPLQTTEPGLGLAGQPKARVAQRDTETGLLWQSQEEKPLSCPHGV